MDIETATQPTASGFIEKRAIEYIPLRERHGKPWQVTPIWISSSANLAGLAVGTFGLFAGLNLLWSIVAIVVGAMFGTFFAAFHATQGPQLGLPQMIQSRPQYGYVGAVLIYVIALLTYFGMSVFATVLMGSTAQLLLGVDPKAGMVVSALIAIVLAVVGYDLVHRVSLYTTVLFVAALAILLVAFPFVIHLPASSFDVGQFSVTGFMLQASAMAVATMTWAPYVSDYTRYLRHLSVSQSFWGTYVGMALSAIVVAGIAAACYAAFPNQDIVASIQLTGDGVFSGFGTIVLAVACLGTIIMVTMNFYGAALTLMSTLDSFRPIRPRRTTRPMWTAIFGIASLLVALVASGAFVTNYLNFLTILFYLIAPWTATNLVDFYFVRHGHYSVREIFNPHGMYGSWNWRGYTAFLTSLIAMAPFMTTAWWTGPLGQVIGFDVAPFIGMIVSACLYYALARRMDLTAERLHIAEADAGLDPDVDDAALHAPAATGTDGARR